LSQVLQIDQLVDEQRIGRFNLGLLFWSFLAMFADGYDIGALSFAQPALERLWHVPKEAFGPASSASLFGILIGAPLLGYVGDRFGRKVAIVAGSVAYGVCSLAIVATHDIEQVIVLRFLTGIGLGGIMPNTIALNSELAPKRLRATLITLMFVGITLGSSAPGIIAYALMPRYGWTVLFLIGGIVPLGVGLCLIRALPESVKFLALRAHRRRTLLLTLRKLRPDLTIPDDAQFTSINTPAREAPSAGLKMLFGGGLGWITPLLWLCFSTAMMSNYFLNSFLPLIFRDSGLPPGKAALAATLYHVGGTVGGLLMSVLLDRFGLLVVAVLFAIAVPAIWALGVVPTTFAGLASLAGASGFAVLGAQFGNNAAAGLLYPTVVRSKGVGWALGVSRFGAIVGPLAGGVMLGMNLPLEKLFLAAAAPMVIGAVAAVVLVRLCYLRLGGLRLEDVPVGAGPLLQSAGATLAD
jgi:MFS transporter, AAHS family, 4-hydroxybenzoate transporter